MDFNFPTNPEEAKKWEPVIIRRALHSRVLVVARSRIEGMWKAYIFPVPGMNHDLEEYLWETEGQQLPEHIARAIFPEFKDVIYAR